MRSGRCEGCGVDYPCIADAPVLMRQPNDVVERWRTKAAIAVNGSERIALSFQGALFDPDIGPLTRVRLQRQLAGWRANTDHVRTLLGGAGLLGDQPVRYWQPSLRDPTLIEHINNIHRDWAWPAHGGHEHERHLNHVRPALPERLGNVLVLGAGACRLAHDIHRHHHAELTVCVDIDPLPMLVAQRLLAGETVPLVEVVAEPRDPQRTCIEHQLRCSDAPAANIHFVYADGTDPPFAAASFDTIITPWFIDRACHDIAQLLPKLARLLRPGGSWVNFGPLIYPADVSPACRYASDEIVELLAARDWQLHYEHTAALTLLASPFSHHERRVAAWTFRAKRPLTA